MHGIIAQMAHFGARKMPLCFAHFSSNTHFIVNIERTRCWADYDACEFGPYIHSRRHRHAVLSIFHRTLTIYYFDDTYSITRLHARSCRTMNTDAVASYCDLSCRSIGKAYLYRYYQCTAFMLYRLTMPTIGTAVVVAFMLYRSALLPSFSYARYPRPNVIAPAAVRFSSTRLFTVRLRRTRYAQML